VPNRLNPMILSDGFFAWGKRTKVFRQLTAFTALSLGAYISIEQAWNAGAPRSHDLYVVLFILCFAGAGLFILHWMRGLLLLVSLVPPLISAIALATGALAYFMYDWVTDTKPTALWGMLVSAIVAGLMVASAIFKHTTDGVRTYT
jgi:hypothetical protein